MRIAPDSPSVLKTTDLFVLAVLQDGPLHGYGIAQAIEARTEGQVHIRPGDLYRVLYRMHEGGLLEEAAEDKRPKGDVRRAYYCITPLGRRTALEQARLLTRVFTPLLARGRSGKVEVS